MRVMLLRKKAIRLLCMAFALLFFVTTVAFAYSANDLVYSVFVSTPNNFASQNCYGYAIGRMIKLNPGYRNSLTYNTHASFRACIISDLNSFGYTVTVVSSPNISLSSNEYLIAYCIGKWAGTSSGTGSYYESDNLAYHFWRRNYGSTNWLHKYGIESGIMRFKYSPTSSNYYRTSNELYNSQTGLFIPPEIFAKSSCTWGYLKVTFPVSQNASGDSPRSDLIDINAKGVDTSAAAQYDAYLGARK